MLHTIYTSYVSSKSNIQDKCHLGYVVCVYHVRMDTPFLSTGTANMLILMLMTFLHKIYIC